MTDVDQDRIKLERLLNFAIGTMGDDDLDSSANKKQKLARDPMSHRIIEKRRRDRMNNCLADLSQLIPATYLKQGQGRIEKTEIIEMAIRHIKALQTQLLAFAADDKYCCKKSFYQGFEQCHDISMQYLLEHHGLLPDDELCRGLKNFVKSKADTIRPTLPGLNHAMPESLSETAIVSTQNNLAQCVIESSDSQLMSSDTLHNQPISPSNTMSHQRFLSIVFSDDSNDFVLQSNQDNAGQSDAQDRIYVSDCDSGLGSCRNVMKRSSSSAGDSRLPSMDVSPRRSSYKFKNDIHLRFRTYSESLPVDAPQQTVVSKPEIIDCKNHSPSELDKDEFKNPLPPVTADDFTSFNGNGHSCSSSNGSSPQYSSGNSSVNAFDTGNGSSADSLNSTVPAFALHPAGVFYIPLVLPASQILPFVKHHRPMGICHPISIPVSFTGPFRIGPPQRSSTLQGVGAFDEDMKQAPDNQQ